MSPDNGEVKVRERFAPCGITAGPANLTDASGFFGIRSWKCARKCDAHPSAGNTEGGGLVRPPAIVTLGRISLGEHGVIICRCGGHGVHAPSSSGH